MLRLRSDRFDPRPLIGASGDAVAALRRFILQLATASGAEALPNTGALRGEPFAVYEDLARYEADVLGARKA